MMLFLFSPMMGNQGGAQFSASEADLIISAIKAGKSKQEAAKLTRWYASSRRHCFREKTLKTTNQKTLPV